MRLGAAFTRFQTLVMQQRFDQFANQVVSFGSCQFPTLGFVVARFEAIESFVEEAFYHIRMAFQCARRAEQDEEENNHNAAAAAAAELFHFTWHRHRVYDFACALACYQLCVDQPLATVVQVTRKPKVRFIVVVVAKGVCACTNAATGRANGDQCRCPPWSSKCAPASGAASRRNRP